MYCKYVAMQRINIQNITEKHYIMNTETLYQNIKSKGSFLCVGLDTDLSKIPPFLLKHEDPAFEFNKRIIDATHKYAVAYKPNLAFYESMGLKGWRSLEKTVEYIRLNYPGIFLIADAKRGDIGNTSKMYAKTFFEIMDFDAVTVAPYMGEDSVTPFLSYSGKYVILLALTSNKGAEDFQYAFDCKAQMCLFEKVIKKSKEWGSPENMMYVVGATQANMLLRVRNIIPNHFLLVPGIGAQGGSLNDVVVNGMNEKCGLLVNSSREILYASQHEDFDTASADKALEVKEAMKKYL